MGHVPRAGECPGGSIASACAVPAQMWPALFLSMRMCAVRPRRRCGSYSESGPHQLCRQGSAFQRHSLTLSARKRAKASLVSCCILRHAPSGVLTPFQKRAAWVWLPMHEAVWHICAETGLAPTTSAAGTGLTPPTSAQGRQTGGSAAHGKSLMIASSFACFCLSLAASDSASFVCTQQYDAIVSISTNGG